MRRIAVVTAGRSDYGIYRPVLAALKRDRRVKTEMWVTGGHLSRRYGYTVREIERDGYEIGARVAMTPVENAPLAIARSMARGTRLFAEVVSARRPDLVLAMGDRYEMHAAVVACVPFALPVAHLHGGEATAGLFDELIRHSISKLSHLHFVSANAYADRLMRMGEEPWRVVVSGAPGLDAIRSLPQVDARALARRIGAPMTPSPIVVTYHPVTLELDRIAAQARELIAGLDREWGRTIVFTYPNADTYSGTVIRAIERFAARRPNVRVVRSLGTTDYLGLLSIAAAMVGNSSSGIIEAPSFGLPVVNIGNRQAGRIRAANVIDVPDDRAAITRGVERALSNRFRASLDRLVNPYGDGRAAKRIARRLSTVPLDDRLTHKRFFDG